MKHSLLLRALLGWIDAARIIFSDERALWKDASCSLVVLGRLFVYYSFQKEQGCA